jgi:hypothetical protein
MAIAPLPPVPERQSRSRGRQAAADDSRRRAGGHPWLDVPAPLRGQHEQRGDAEEPQDDAEVRLALAHLADNAAGDGSVEAGRAHVGAEGRGDA